MTIYTSTILIWSEVMLLDVGYSWHGRDLLDVKHPCLEQNQRCTKDNRDMVGLLDAYVS